MPQLSGKNITFENGVLSLFKYRSWVHTDGRWYQEYGSVKSMPGYTQMGEIRDVLRSASLQRIEVLAVMADPQTAGMLFLEGNLKSEQILTAIESEEGIVIIPKVFGTLSLTIANFDHPGLETSSFVLIDKDGRKI